MKLCVDEVGFKLPAAPESWDPCLSAFQELVEECHSSGFTVVRFSQLDYEVVAGGLEFCQLLYDPSYGVDRDIRIGLGTALERCVNWDDAAAIPTPNQVVIGGLSIPATSVSMAHESALSGEAVGLLCLDNARSGAIKVTRAGKDCEVHFIVTSADFLPFLRHVPEVENMDADQYMAHAPTAFPDLHFVPGLAKQARRFSRSFSDLRCEITRHLASSLCANVE